MHKTQGHGQTCTNRTPSPESKSDMSLLSSPALRHRWNPQEQPLSDQFRRKAKFPSHVDYLDIKETGGKRDLACQVLSPDSESGRSEGGVQIRPVSASTFSTKWLRLLDTWAEKIKSNGDFAPISADHSNASSERAGSQKQLYLYECGDKTVDALHCVTRCNKRLHGFRTDSTAVNLTPLHKARISGRDSAHFILLECTTPNDENQF